MAKPRVAYVIPQIAGRGGWATFARGAIVALQQYVTPILVVERSQADFARQAVPGAEIAALPTIFPEDWSANSPSMMRRILPSLLQAKRQELLGADLVHALEMFPAGWIGEALARKEKAPLVLTAHGTYAILWKRWAMLDVAYRTVLRSAAAVCPVSEGTRVKWDAFYKECTSRMIVRVIHGGTDSAARIPRGEALRRDRSRAPVLLSVGGLKPRKGYHVSLEAFGILQKKHPDARYVIVGKGVGTAYHRELETIVERDALDGVEFTGAVDDAELDRRFREATLFALLSQEEGLHFEGFGLVYLEAGAYGLPAVGTLSGGIPDAVGHESSGLLVPSGDPECAAQALVRVAGDPRLAARFGEAGRDRAERLTWERYAEEQWALYREVLAR